MAYGSLNFEFSPQKLFQSLTLGGGFDDDEIFGFTGWHSSFPWLLNVEISADCQVYLTFHLTSGIFKPEKPCLIRKKLKI